MSRDNVVDFPEGLDPAQFRVSGTDTKGHYQKVWVNLQPMHVHMIDVHSSDSTKIPYRNRGDFLRHSIVRHLHWIERIARPVNSVTGAADAISAIMREIEFRMEFENGLQKLSKIVNELVDRGDEVEAQRLVLDVLREVNKMPEGYWKSKYRAVINEKNKKLLDSIPMATVEELFGE